MQRLNDTSKLADFNEQTNSSGAVNNFSKNYIYWAILDGLLFLLIVLGNFLTILAVRLCSRLRQSTSNLFILNLAISDLLVGLSLPYHLTFYLEKRLAHNKAACILRFAMIHLACSASIYNLISIAVDRYIAVVHPLKYSRYITKTTALICIFVGWSHAIAVATVPIYWNCFESDLTCEFETVLPRFYTAALLCPLICLVWLSMLLLYWKICRVACTHVKRLKDTGYDNSGVCNCKSAKLAVLVLGSFSICWFPFLVLAVMRVLNIHILETPSLYKGLFSLAMANSGINPMIYAWKNTEFRRAFQRLLCFTRPDRDEFNSSLKDYLRKQSELSKQSG